MEIVKFNPKYIETRIVYPNFDTWSIPGYAFLKTNVKVKYRGDYYLVPVKESILTNKTVGVTTDDLITSFKRLTIRCYQVQSSYKVGKLEKSMVIKDDEYKKFISGQEH